MSLLTRQMIGAREPALSFASAKHVVQPAARCGIAFWRRIAEWTRRDAAPPLAALSDHLLADIGARRSETPPRISFDQF
ncbi:MAG TPA: hypothetical protein VME92_20130 [Acetobacteraceae bacterium]|nr:hypothetical protein [Acetobacteraceae bacterium]